MMKLRTMTRISRVSPATVFASLASLYLAAHIMPLLLADLCAWWGSR